MPAVLHLVQPTVGGVARYVALVAADQARRGWPVTVACPDGGELAEELAAVGVARRRWTARRGPGWWTLPEAASVARLVREVRPEVVHLHAATAGLAGRLAVRGRVPTLFSPHGWSWLAARPALSAPTLAWERFAARWCTVSVCVGHDEEALAAAGGLPGRRVIVRNGVDLRWFTPADATARAAARRKLQLDHHAATVLCLGRVCHQKGQDVLLDGWPAVRRAVPGARLHMVGDDGPGSRRIRDVPAGVHRVATVRDVRPWLAAADVVVLPSRWEGLPLTVLEALAVGRPVVGTDVAGLGEVLEGRVGEQVAVEDPDALAGALVRRLVDRALRRDEEARARCAARAFDLRDTLDGLADLTRSVNWGVSRRAVSVELRSRFHVDDRGPGRPPSARSVTAG